MYHTTDCPAIGFVALPSHQKISPELGFKQILRTTCDARPAPLEIIHQLYRKTFNYISTSLYPFPYPQFNNKSATQAHQSYERLSSNAIA